MNKDTEKLLKKSLEFEDKKYAKEIKTLIKVYKEYFNSKPENIKDKHED